jgi:hypothetical protein
MKCDKCEHGFLSVEYSAGSEPISEIFYCTRNIEDARKWKIVDPKKVKCDYVGK